MPALSAPNPAAVSEPWVAGRRPRRGHARRGGASRGVFLGDKEQHPRPDLDKRLATLAHLAELEHIPNPVVSGKLVNAAATLGELGIPEELLLTALSRDDLDALYHGQFLALMGDRHMARGDIAAATTSDEEAVDLFREIEIAQLIAVTRGMIAGIFQTQGELDAALEMHLSRLPDVQERKDADGSVHIHFRCAGIRCNRVITNT